MTNEEIEAARERISMIVNTYQGIAHFGMGGTPEQVLECVAAIASLDALCAAARGDSLVGKRVRIIRDGAKGLEGTVLAKSLVRDYRWFVSWDDGIEGPCSREDFEVLEGDDAE